MASANHINSGCTGMMGSGLWGNVELLTETRSLDNLKISDAKRV